jgi:hypothetical protein
VLGALIVLLLIVLALLGAKLAPNDPAKPYYDPMLSTPPRAHL